MLKGDCNRDKFILVPAVSDVSKMPLAGSDVADAILKNDNTKIFFDALKTRDDSFLDLSAHYSEQCYASECKVIS